MSDNVTDEQVDSTATPGGDGTQGGEAPKTFTQEQVNGFLAKQKGELTSKYGDYDDVKAKAVKFDEANARATAAEQKAATELRGRIAATKGVPVGSLTGETEDELAASADALLAWKGEGEPKPEPKQKRNPAGSGGGLKSGATGSGGDAIDPKEKAAAALRELRGTS